MGEDKKSEKDLNEEELDQCVSAPHPEMARNDDEDEPCDDNRASK